MTIEEKLVEMLCNHGLLKPQAVEIIERAKADKVNELMFQQWRDDVNDHPDRILELLWISIKDHTRQWIDENCPGAWFRPIFEK